MPVQSVRETQQGRAQRLLDTTCDALGQRSVAILDAKQPEADFSRWNAAVREVVALAGPQFVAALDATVDIEGVQGRDVTGSGKVGTGWQARGREKCVRACSRSPAFCPEKCFPSPKLRRKGPQNSSKAAFVSVPGSWVGVLAIVH